MTASTDLHPGSSLSLVDMLLAEQSATAVERFAQFHESAVQPLQSPRYRDLIPVGSPGEGEQYAFEVNLDACSGCKACVTACHNLNGLESGETWRGVGLLVGGSAELPVIQHVTTACHHCLDPACLEGCPVAAYEKDEFTGIVRHLDDQCIGCQYCIFKCPYDVPKYSRSKGIVRKCDMCHDRLAGGEAPACVQSCPNEAIRITVVSQRAVVEESETNQFLPGAPEPGYTLPTTRFKTDKLFPRNLLPADYHAAHTEHAHWPLVIMLVLTQMSVGGFVIDQWLPDAAGWTAANAHPVSRFVHLTAALILGLLGMGAAVLHLGRPLYAYRCLIGLRTSWLSREIVAFGMFAALASLYVAASGLDLAGTEVSSMLRSTLGFAAAGSGIVGVACSVMIYADTRRAFWSWPLATVKFVGTALILGLPTVILISIIGQQSETLTAGSLRLCVYLMCAATVKLLFESTVFAHLRDRRNTALKRTARLLSGDLARTTLIRSALGIAGGVLIPGALVVNSPLAAGSAIGSVLGGVAIGLSLVLLLAGETLERYLFFAAVVAPRMPGAPG